jgi:hypothetical protein
VIRRRSLSRDRRNTPRPVLFLSLEGASINVVGDFVGSSAIGPDPPERIHLHVGHLARAPLPDVQIGVAGTGTSYSGTTGAITRAGIGTSDSAATKSAVPVSAQQTTTAGETA